MSIEVVRPRTYYTYRCQYCGQECRKVQITGSDVPLTGEGDYGSSGSPTPESFADEMYASTTVGFVAVAALISAWTDSGDPAYNTFTSSGSNITAAVKSGGAGNTYAVSNYWTSVAGAKYVVAINLTLNSGTAPTFQWYRGDFTQYTSKVLENGTNTFTYIETAGGTTARFYLSNGANNANWSATITATAVPTVGSGTYYLVDGAARFGEKRLSSEMPIRISTTSGTNDGDYTIAARGVSRGEILLSSSDSLTTEAAATAGTVTISRIIYKPDESAGGCPFCHSRNSRQ